MWVPLLYAYHNQLPGHHQVRLQVMRARLASIRGRGCLAQWLTKLPLKLWVTIVQNTTFQAIYNWKPPSADGLGMMEPPSAAENTAGEKMIASGWAWLIPVGLDCFQLRVIASVQEKFRLPNSDAKWSPIAADLDPLQVPKQVRSRVPRLRCRLSQPKKLAPGPHRTCFSNGCKDCNSNFPK